MAKDKAGKKKKKGKEKAEEIIAETVAKAKAEPKTPSEKKPRAKKQGSDEDIAIGQKVKDLRDKGLAWWQCANELGLPGSGSTLAEGKKGAGQARKYYKIAFGELPERAPRSPRGEGPTGTRRRRSGALVAEKYGDPVFTDEHTDDEVIRAVNGSELTWLIHLTKNGEVYHVKDEVAAVKRGTAKITGTGEGRCLSFYESPDDAARIASGPSRTVKVNKIVKVV